MVWIGGNWGFEPLVLQAKQPQLAARETLSQTEYARALLGLTMQVAPVEMIK